MKVGFIGLGVMGAPMAGHLIAGGHEVYLSDLKPVPASLIEKGGKAGGTASNCAAAGLMIRRRRSLSNARTATPIAPISLSSSAVASIAFRQVKSAGLTWT